MMRVKLLNMSGEAVPAFSLRDDEGGRGSTEAELGYPIPHLVPG